MLSDGEAWFAVAFDITEPKETELRLRGLLTDDHLLAYTQPILDQRRRTVAQEELLVRLRGSSDPEEIIGPAEFLPDAERCGLIGLVDRWMVDQGMALARHGRRAEVNLSALSIGDPELAAELADTISRAGSSAEN